MKKQIESLEKRDPLLLIGMEYHYKTELFDRKISNERSEISGDAMPRTGTQASLMSKNAVLERDCAYEKGENMGYSKRQVQAAIQKASRFSFEELREFFTN